MVHGIREEESSSAQRLGIIGCRIIGTFWFQHPGAGGPKPIDVHLTGATTYASQFELLFGRLSSYDEGMMLNQFVWGLQPELACSVSLHYPKSIAQAVSLAETTELAVKASHRPVAKGGQSGRAPTTQNRGRGQWRGRGRGGFRGGRSMGSGGRTFGGGQVVEGVVQEAVLGL